MKFSIKIIALCFFAGVGFVSCKNDDQSPGVEYMPDMYRSPAVEAYVDYENNGRLSARHPVAGTIPFTADSIARINTIPYTLPPTPEGYEASASIKSPLPTTKQYIEEGQIIFDKMCLHCHGEKGMADGAVVTNGGFPPPPAYNGQQLKNLPEGKMFHSITHGKGAMGPHKSLLNKVERWKVIQYVKVLQNDGKSPFDEAAPAGDSTATQPTAQSTSAN